MEEEKSMRLVALLLVGFLISGCSTQPQRIEISAKPIEKPKLILPDADELRLKDMKFIIITKDNAEAVFEKLEKEKKDPILIGLTDDGYEVLALNNSDIMKLIQQQKAIIAAYKNYYEESEKTLEDANKQIEEVNAATQKEEPDRPFWKVW